MMAPHSPTENGMNGLSLSTVRKLHQTMPVYRTEEGW